MNWMEDNHFKAFTLTESSHKRAVRQHTAAERSKKNSLMRKHTARTRTGDKEHIHGQRPGGSKEPLTSQDQSHLYNDTGRTELFIMFFNSTSL